MLLGRLRGCTRGILVEPLTIGVDPNDQVIAHGPCLAQLVRVAVVHHVIAAERRAGSAGQPGPLPGELRPIRPRLGAAPGLRRSPGPAAALPVTAASPRRSRAAPSAHLPGSAGRSPGSAPAAPAPVKRPSPGAPPAPGGSRPAPFAAARRARRAPPSRGPARPAALTEEAEAAA